MHQRFVLILAIVSMLYLTGCDSASAPARMGSAHEQAAATPSGAAAVGPSEATTTAAASGSPQLSTATPAPSATAAPSSTPAATQTAQAASPTRVPQYIFPVQPADVASYGVCHHDYPASDIFAPSGTRFVAVTDGVVDFVSKQDTWDQQVDDPTTRGGLAVAIIGDDGVRYYGSHLSQVAEGIEPGVRVSAGQQLGLIGNTGSAAPTEPHLHFGISHPTTADDWAVRRGEINPYPYLNQWRKGINQTPDLSIPRGGAC